MQAIIESSIREHQEVLASLGQMVPALARAGELLVNTIQAGGRVFICGNGGSAADAQHFAAELTGRFEKERRALPAVALTTDTSALTAIGNDYGFDVIFSRQLEALALPGDLLIGLSTSGNSTNVAKAVDWAKQNGVTTIGLLGRDGGALARLVDLSLVAPSQRTARIQEVHILILHMLCEVLDA